MKKLIDFPDKINRILEENSKNFGIPYASYVKILVGIGLSLSDAVPKTIKKKGE